MRIYGTWPCPLLWKFIEAFNYIPFGILTVKSCVLRGILPTNTCNKFRRSLGISNREIGSWSGDSSLHLFIDIWVHNRIITFTSTYIASLMHYCSYTIASWSKILNYTTYRLEQLIMMRIRFNGCEEDDLEYKCECMCWESIIKYEMKLRGCINMSVDKSFNKIY